MAIFTELWSIAESQLMNKIISSFSNTQLQILSKQIRISAFGIPRLVPDLSFSGFAKTIKTIKIKKYIIYITNTFVTINTAFVNKYSEPHLHKLLPLQGKILSDHIYVPILLLFSIFFAACPTIQASFINSSEPQVSCYFGFFVYHVHRM